MFFGERKTEEIRKSMNTARPGDGAGDTHVFNVPVNANTAGLANIGKRILEQKIDLQQEFMELTQLKDFYITEADFYKILKKNHYDVS